MMDILPLVAGVGIIVGIGFAKNSFDVSGLEGFGQFMYIVLAGFLGGIAFVLPGLSFMHFLLIMDLDQTFGIAVDGFDWSFLVPFGIGLIVGFGITAKLLYTLIKKHKRVTYLVIIGFIVGSVALLVSTEKYIPVSADIWFCILAFILGTLLVFGITFGSRFLSNKRN